MQHDVQIGFYCPALWLADYGVYYWIIVATWLERLYLCDLYNVWRSMHSLSLCTAIIKIRQYEAIIQQVLLNTTDQN